MHEPALIGLADSRQLTGKVLKLRLMVIVLASGRSNVLHVRERERENVAAAKLLVFCLTSQAEGCSLELWNTHKGFLKMNFPRIVDEVRAQQREGQENGDQSGQQCAQEEAAEHQSSNDGGEDRSQCATSTSSASPTTSSQVRPSLQVTRHLTI